MKCLSFNKYLFNTNEVLGCGRILGKEMKPELLPSPGESGEWSFRAVSSGAQIFYKCLHLDDFLVTVLLLRMLSPSILHDSAWPLPPPNSFSRICAAHFLVPMSSHRADFLLHSMFTYLWLVSVFSFLFKSLCAIFTIRLKILHYCIPNIMFMYIWNT